MYRDFSSVALAATAGAGGRGEERMQIAIEGREPSTVATEQDRQAPAYGWNWPNARLANAVKQEHGRERQPD